MSQHKFTNSVKKLEWHPSIIPDARRAMQVNSESEVSLGYTAGPCLKINEIILNMTGTVVHAYDLSYSGGLSKKIVRLRSV